MIPVFQGLFNPYSPQGQGNGLVSNDTILMVGLSALSLLGANAFDRDAPGLAFFMRCVPVGCSLIWLFNRCLPSRGYVGRSHYTPAAPPIIIHQQAPRHRSSRWFFDNWFSPVMRPAPIHRNGPPPQAAPFFPPVHRVPAQPSSFPPVHRTPANPTGFPSVQRAPAQPPSFPTAPKPTAPPVNFPSVQRTSAQPGSFPTVQRAPAQMGGAMPSAPPSHSRGGARLWSSGK